MTTAVPVTDQCTDVARDSVKSIGFAIIAIALSAVPFLDDGALWASICGAVGFVLFIVGAAIPSCTDASTWDNTTFAGVTFADGGDWTDDSLYALLSTAVAMEFIGVCFACCVL